MHYELLAVGFVVGVFATVLFLGPRGLPVDQPNRDKQPDHWSL